MAKKKRKTKRKNKKKSFFKGLFKFAFVTGLWVGIFLSLMLAWYATELPSITKDASFERKSSITVKAIDGSTLARYGEVMGNSVTVEDLPPHLIYAVMAIEDRRFYSHFGMDPLGFARAMFVNVKKGGIVQGGSTITQQLAKNLFLSQERTIKRKIQEAMLAFWLEYELSKDEILSAYLNRVYMGAGNYGVDAATKHYFNKSVQDVTLREAAILAGLLKAPSRYSPTNNPILANQRANVVLRSMVDAGYIDEEEANNLKSLPPRPSRKPTGANSVRYFTDWIVDGLEDIIGTPDADIIVTTTLNPRAQDAAKTALIKHLTASGAERNMSQGAIISMAMDGAVISMVGGRDYGLSQFNRATQGRRPPGSSFKPVVYLTALEQGWEPDDTIMDEPFDESEHSYTPKNFNHEYFDEVSLLEAITFSLNTAAVRLMKEVGVGNVMRMAKNLGIISPLEPDLSLTLGSSGVSLLEMATAYTTIGNGGYKVFPYAITRIESEDGTLYYQRTEQNYYQQVVSDVSIENIKFMMQSVVENGTGRGANPGFPVAGKTGTSQESRDALFIGFSDELTTAVWVGNDDNSPMDKVTGGSFPARIWGEVMAKTRGLHRIADRDHFRRDAFLSLMSTLTREVIRNRDKNEKRFAPNAHENSDRYN